MGDGVFVGLLQAFGGPVGAAVSVDLAGLFRCVKGLYNWADRLVGVVAVQHIQVDAVDLEAGEAVVEVGLDVVGRDPFAVLAVVRAFAEDDDLVAHAALIYPLTEGALTVAAAVAVGSVKAVAAGRVKGVQHGEGIVEIAGIHPHRPQHQPGDRFVDTGDVGIEHVGNSSELGGYIGLIPGFWPQPSLAIGLATPLFLQDSRIQQRNRLGLRQRRTPLQEGPIQSNTHRHL